MYQFMSVIIQTILVVDDEHDNLLLIRTSLELTVNWTIITANSGHEGICQAKAKRPEVILSDLDLPKMNGIEMLWALQKHPSTKKIPAILLTGTAKVIKAHEYNHLGVKAVIPKPFDPLTLANHIIQAVNLA